MVSTVLVINYELGPDATPDDYSKLARTLADLGAKRLLLSSWAIRTPLTPAELGDRLRAVLGSRGDRLLIVQVAGHHELNALVALENV